MSAVNININIPYTRNPQNLASSTIKNKTNKEHTIEWPKFRTKVAHTLSKARSVNAQFANDRKIDGNGAIEATQKVLQKVAKFQETHRNWRKAFDDDQHVVLDDIDKLEMEMKNKPTSDCSNQVESSRASKIKFLEPILTPKVTKVFLPSLQTISELQDAPEPSVTKQTLERNIHTQTVPVTVKPTVKFNDQASIIITTVGPKIPPKKDKHAINQANNSQIDDLKEFDKAIRKIDDRLIKLRHNLGNLLDTQSKLPKTNASTSASITTAVQIKPIKTEITYAQKRSPEALPQELIACHESIVKAKRVCAEFMDDMEHNLPKFELKQNRTHRPTNKHFIV